MTHMKTQFLLILALGAGLLLVQHGAGTPVAASTESQSDVDRPAATAEWLQTIPLTNSDNTPFGAGAPTIAISPDESKLVVAYVFNTDTDDGESPNPNTDIYYVLSDDEGSFWADGPDPLPRALHVSSGVESRSVSIAFDSSNNGHAVWLEGGSIVYKAEADWSASATPAPVEISDTSTTTASIGPSLAVAPDDSLHVVWGQRTTAGAPPNIYYAKRPSGSTTWDDPILINPGSTFESSAPVLAVDASGVLHLAWQEQTSFSPPRFNINYARSTNNGDSWQSLANVSSRAALPTGWNALLPQIVATDDQVEILMTGQDPSQALPTDVQGVFRTVCQSGNCTNLSNWGDGLNVLNGSYLGVNDLTPSNMLIGASRMGGCVQSVFHGLKTGNTERIWYNNGCGTTGATAVTDASTNVRYINPTLTQSRNWFLHLAYERIVGADENPEPSQIYYRRMETDIFLPIILRGAGS